MKKNLTISKLMMLVVMAILPFSMYAQEGKKKGKPIERYWYIQADGGLSINHGDLANYESWMFTNSDYGPNQYGPNPKGEGNPTEEQTTLTE